MVQNKSTATAMHIKEQDIFDYIRTKSNLTLWGTQLESSHNASKLLHFIKIDRFTILDHIKNIHVRGSFKVTPIQEKILESRLKWYGDIMWQPLDHMTRTVLNISTQPRRRGRPRLTWMSVIDRDIKSAKITSQTTQDRTSWRRLTRRADPKINGTKARQKKKNSNGNPNYGLRRVSNP
ncbi:uncharacterized protein LOC131853188 [Achroia grisella]|uniref:uncharacterized protein LOC131853188 n=1 Tax=Achroia grisella TaxID=688607 RepID=UPI0027D2E79B|nr:uncharacterized protein LOC131853188 [Achroia grisella]